MIKLYYIEEPEKIKRNFSLSKKVCDLVRAEFGGRVKKSITGKPYITGCKNAYISISHCGNMAVVALSDKAVGVDIEKIKPYSKKLANILPEKEFISDEISFFKVWTIKEAYFKAAGGLLMKIIRQMCVVKDGQIVDKIEKFAINTFEKSDYIVSIVTIVE